MAAVPLEPSFLNQCCSMLRFRTPVIKPTNMVNYTTSFKSSIGSPESKDLAENLTATRKQMAGELGSSASTTVTRLQTVDAYLVFIQKLLDSLNNQAPVGIDKQLVFEWRGALSPPETFSMSNEIIYELGMVLHTKAMLHFQSAADAIALDMATNVTSGAQHLRIAAGIYGTVLLVDYVFLLTKYPVL